VRELDHSIENERANEDERKPPEDAHHFDLGIGGGADALDASSHRQSFECGGLA
jgi:hypothetical protein